ncbi:hypothetical protein CROQUDRAFT_134435 [Cronartium quercuum f. sp. fusiforme G11]|uniref:AB hydrolase-1 domain-containing protein n=1 Tax=Cronartium quercuum f. sp. fusiforme G11 TaxID=708437 RepID=A0A9P6NEA3_9BASI|nr:hypothetical protein CROQUDRAFT_134435 [Cronartium quercuum f. sp. fusiforme G11]
MPYLTVAPEVELFYEIRHSTSPKPSSLTPWLLILHPIFLDLTFASVYIDGPGQLLERFNILLIDFRCHGRTRSKVSPRCDLWTLAVDLAVALDKLNLPPLHVFAGDSLSTEVSIRMAGLFPELVLSVCMSAMPPATEQGFIQTAFFTVLASWLNPELPEDWEASVTATQWWLYGPRTHRDPVTLDTWAGVMMRRYPPCKATQSLGSCVAYTEREAPPSGIYKLVHAPILALHGDFENIYDMPSAQARFNEFVNAGPGSKFRVLKGGPLQVFDANPELLKSLYYPWIDSILSTTAETELYQQQIPIRPDFHRALQTLASLYDDPSIAERDAMTSDSFYSLSNEKIESNSERLEFLSSIEKSKFSFVGGGAPERWTGASFAEMHPWRQVFFE